MNNDEARRAYQRFINHARQHLGWSDADVAEYADSVKVLMGKDDAATLALFPDGLYKSAEEARQGAVKYWGACI
jgi:hypothetical protein